jgi:hypothetical protein
VPLLYLVALENSGDPHPAHTKVPRRFSLFRGLCSHTQRAGTGGGGGGGGGRKRQEGCDCRQQQQQQQQGSSGRKADACRHVAASAVHACLNSLQTAGGIDMVRGCTDDGVPPLPLHLVVGSPNLHQHPSNPPNLYNNPPPLPTPPPPPPIHTHTPSSLPPPAPHLVVGSSVPAWRSTLYWAGVSSARHSSSLWNTCPGV